MTARPMPTDVMHDETCRELARVLAERNDGFMQMLLVSGDNARDQAFYEEVATLSGRPVIMNVVQAFDHKPHIHRRVLDWLKSCRERGIRVVGQGLTTDAGFTFTFEDWNLFDDSAGRGARPRPARATSAWPSSPIRRAARRCATSCRSRRPGRCRRSPSSGPSSRRTRSGSTTRWPMPAEKMGKHPVDVMLDMAVEEDLKTEFFAAPPNGKIEHLKELIDDPYVLFGVSRRRRPHQVPDGRPLSDRDAVQGGARAQDAEPGGRALAAVGAAGRGRGLPRPRRAEEGRAGRHRGLRLRRAAACCPTRSPTTCRAANGAASSAPQGYKYVLVNGEVTIRNDQPTNTHSGRLLRHGA